MTRLWMRDEARETERRAALTPADAEVLVKSGFNISVEESDKRAFSHIDYQAAGCELVESGSWIDAPTSSIILGLKELPEAPLSLRHRFIHFAHLYKDQTGWEHEIARFEQGGGSLFDIEYLVGLDHRRVAAFGYWAGWIGAAVGLWRLLERRAGKNEINKGVHEFSSKDDVTETLRGLREQGSGEIPTVLVVGANGRSGTGAADCLESAGVAVTRWDMAETADLDRAALLSHDMLVNCVLVTGPGLLLVTADDLSPPASRLKVLSDVACDPLSDFNPLPVYKAPTSWSKPFEVIGKNDAGEDIEITAIDNLPSLLPGPASEDFSSQLVKSLARFPDGPEWQASLQSFRDACERASRAKPEQM